MGPIAETIIRIHNSNPEEATRLLQDLKVDAKSKNKVEKILTKEYPNEYLDMVTRIGDEERITKAQKDIEKFLKEEERNQEKEKRNQEKEEGKQEKKKKYMPKNPIKRILSLGHLLFKPKVIQSKKLYNRKRLKQNDKTLS